MGPLSDSQLTISPVFFFTLVDLWGPLTAYVPGYEKVTRSTADKPHQIYILVFACCATDTVNCQVIEGKDTGFCLDGFNRFFCQTTVSQDSVQLLIWLEIQPHREESNFKLLSHRDILPMERQRRKSTCCSNLWKVRNQELQMYSNWLDVYLVIN